MCTKIEKMYPLLRSLGFDGAQTCVQAAELRAHLLDAERRLLRLGPSGSPARARSRARARRRAACRAARPETRAPCRHDGPHAVRAHAARVLVRLHQLRALKHCATEKCFCKS